MEKYGIVTEIRRNGSLLCEVRYFFDSWSRVKEVVKPDWVCEAHGVAMTLDKAEKNLGCIDLKASDFVGIFEEHQSFKI